MKKQEFKIAGDEITFSTFANIDSDSLTEAITVTKTGSYWYLYAAKPYLENPAISQLLADSITTGFPPTLVDWNGDNQLDFLFPNAGTQNVLLLMNTGNLNFQKAFLSFGTHALSKIRLADLSNDGHREVIVSNVAGGWSIFKEHEGVFDLLFDSTDQVSDFTIFDFDNNGYADIALSGSDPSGSPYLKILEFEDSLKLKRTIYLANPVNGKIESGDLNHDGQFDLIVAGINATGNTTTASFVNNDSTFIAGKSFPALTGSALTITDFDSDGKADISFGGKNITGSFLNWIKTFSGDSIILATQNVTLSAFGDYDRDGDLDLLVSTDTLGIILYENSAVKNTSPSKSSREVSATIFNRLFLYWDKSVDDHTNQLSLTYDLILTQSGNEVIDGEFDPDNYLRQIMTHGNRSLNNFLLMKASTGIYNFKIEAVDNSFFAKEIIQGSSAGSCAIQQPKTITTCHQKPVRITEAQPVMWFSFAKGYMGTATNINMPARTDTLFSFLPVANADVCSAITIYIINSLNQDTLRISQNFIGCEGSPLTFRAADEWRPVTWKDSEENTKGSGNILDYSIEKDDKIIATGKNAAGCLLKLTENIKLSKPIIEVDGMEYKILYGNSVTLGVTGAKEYFWQPSSGLDNITSSHPIASPETTTTYTVTGIDSLGCSAQATVVVDVLHKAFVPNLFTPNSDGKNDELKIYGLTGARNFHFSVYNREGSVVYESTDWSGVAWDGTKSGTLQPSGLYYWKVEGILDNGQPLTLNEKTKGSILLVR